MNFQVPQFIEEKPKIFWFLTLPQFIYLAVGGAASFVVFHLFNTFVAFFLILFITMLSVALAFGKVNGMSMPAIMSAALSFLWKPRTYAWRRDLPGATADAPSLDRIQALRNTMGIQERLKSIALSVTTGKFLQRFAGQRAPTSEGKERFQVVTYLTGEKKVAKRIDYR
ncbi:MAG: PrgI family protein [Patescibacteria group bacterium]